MDAFFYRAIFTKVSQARLRRTLPHLSGFCAGHAWEAGYKIPAWLTKCLYLPFILLRLWCSYEQLSLPSVDRFLVTMPLPPFI